jgi:hypothetical protein
VPGIAQTVIRSSTFHVVLYRRDDGHGPVSASVRYLYVIQTRSSSPIEAAVLGF